MQPLGSLLVERSFTRDPIRFFMIWLVVAGGDRRHGTVWPSLSGNKAH